MLLWLSPRYCKKHPNFLLPAVRMQQAMKKKIIGEKWWAKTAFGQRQDFCDFNFETVKSISSRLKKDKYDRSLEVNNYSDTSSEAAARAKEEEIQRKYDDFRGIVRPDPVAVAAAAIAAEREGAEEEEDEEEDKAKRRSRKSKKVPVAMTSTKRRASLASMTSTGSIGETSTKDAGSIKRQRSVGNLSRQGSSLSRQNSIKSQKSFGE